MAVQQHVLNWLYSVLTSEYHDVNRTYNDVAQALSQFPSLAPRTDVHTFDNGVSALLVHLTGTVPVVFRGTPYRFPVAIWVPHAYPREAPFAYVTPTDTMVVRPGQHVDPQGRIYHPYLVRWPDFWDKSSILDFLAIMQDIFSKEPPVVARQQPRPPQQQSNSPTPPPVPPLPQDMTRPSPLQTPVANPSRSGPPLPPPKTNDLPQAAPSPANRTDGPPLPPLPPGLQHRTSQYSANNSNHELSSPSRLSRYDAAPPLPQQAPQRQPPPMPQAQAQSYPPAFAQHQAVARIHPQQQQQHGYAQESAPIAYQQPQDHRRPSYGSGPPGPPGPPPYQAGPPQNWQQPPQQMQPQPQPKPAPPPDLMDEPLTLSLPGPSDLSPPPIPPNPEKDALLRQLGSTLYAMRQRARHQNEISLAGLAAQRVAMLSAMQRLQNDSANIAPLSALLASNTSILQSSLQEADAVITKSRTQKPPEIDDLLVASTVVGNQLYDVVAEERALGDAIFILGRAVERGRVSPAVFAKTTRSLAREWYLKKALARKIAKGMGLAV